MKNNTDSKKKRFLENEIDKFRDMIPSDLQDDEDYLERIHRLSEVADFNPGSDLPVTEKKPGKKILRDKNSKS
jgi:hypothetical protein